MTENTGSYHDGCLIECYSASGCTDSDASREDLLMLFWSLSMPVVKMIV